MNGSLKKKIVWVSIALVGVIVATAVVTSLISKAGDKNDQISYDAPKVVNGQKIVYLKDKQKGVKTQFINFVYKKYDLPRKASLSASAENNLYFVFDYACPWCMKWMREVYPELYEKYISKAKASYTSQPVALLEQESLSMAQVDYILETSVPAEKYYEIQRRFEKEAVPHGEENKSGWASEQYVRNIFKEYRIPEKILDSSIPDRLTLTRKFTRQFKVETVPTVYVNGIKVHNPFDIKEIESILRKEINEGDSITYEEEVPQEKK